MKLLSTSDTEKTKKQLKYLRSWHLQIEILSSSAALGKALS